MKHCVLLIPESSEDKAVLAEMVNNGAIKLPLKERVEVFQEPATEPTYEGIVENCGTCGAVMNLETKKSKKTGKNYQAFFCANSTIENPHPIKFPD